MSGGTGRALSAADLSDLELFRAVPPEWIERLLAEAGVRELADGELLIGRGATNRFLFVVVDGQLRIHLDLRDGPIAELGPGDTVGEISLFDKLPASAYVLAAGRCVLLRLDERLVWELVRASHGFAHRLLVVLTSRIRSANSVVDRSLKLQKEHYRDATIDALTGLYNRRWLDESLPFEMGRARRQLMSLGYIMLDVDHFKACNDRFGHVAGDTILQHLARSIQASVRPLDMGIRYGGEEFAVLLPGADGEQTAVIAERLRQAIAAMEIQLAGAPPLTGITISLGTALMREGDGPLDLIGRADRALYQAKTEGRNRVCAAD